MFNQIIYLTGALIAALFLVMMFVPMLVMSARKNQLYDKPSARKVHKQNIPRIGGLSFSPIMIVVICIAIGAALYFNLSTITFNRTTEIKALCFIAGLMVIYMMGFIDDILGMSYKAKFIVQIIAALFIVAPGNVITNFNGILFINEVPYWFGFVVTLAGVVLIINAFNLSDGIDGLCSGLGITFCLIFLAICFHSNAVGLENLIAATTIGILSAFFYFNVVAKKYKTFMGDTGSYTIGFICAYLFLLTDMNIPAEKDHLIVGISMLFVPVFDTLRVFCVRMMHGNSPFKPDKNHLHHKLISLGLKHVEAVVVILSIQVMIVVVNKLLYEDMGLNINIIFLINITSMVVFNIFLNFANSKKRDGSQTEILQQEKSN